MLRTAIVHYWLVRMRGGEAVLKNILAAHPDADVYTNVYDPQGVQSLFDNRAPPTTTWVNDLPFAKKVYPLYLPFMPGALERLDMNSYDLIISSEAGPSKWVIPAPNARHICYVHSPMRYLWDQRLAYRNRVPWLGRPLFDHITSALRSKDVMSAARVDEFVANSTFVAERIRKYYRRDALVIHPPVQADDFGAPLMPDDYYLFAGQLVSYKNVRHAVDACLALGRRLIVVGDGPDRKYVEQFADQGIEYRGSVPRAELVALMRRCRALLFPGIEDFGIVPVEVLAAGRPVIGVGRGGLLDTVTPGATGIFYDEMTAQGLSRAIQTFEEWEPGFRPSDSQAAAAHFSPAEFERKWGEMVGGSVPQAVPHQRLPLKVHAVN